MELCLRELAKRYHEETEAYDRGVCTGPVVRGSVMPANPREFRSINRNALSIRRRLLIEGQVRFPELSMQQLGAAIRSVAHSYVHRDP